VVVVPSHISAEILALALGKASKEDQFRDAVRNGMSLSTAYEKFHVL
jgi:regulator of RNase E activity RraA